MEQALLRLEQERASAAQHYHDLKLNETSVVTEATATLAQALRHVLKSSSAYTGEKNVATTPTVTAEWLVELCQSHSSSSASSSESNNVSLLSPLQMARAIWSASQLQDEAQQQAALFDALGESGMDLLLHVAPYLQDIQRIPKQDMDHLNQRLGGGDDESNNAAAFSAGASVTMVDPEERRRQRLLQEAQTASQVAALAQAELASIGLSTTTTTTTTHRVVRKSELRAQKAADKAAQRAEAAWRAAREAGAVVDASEFLSISSDEMGAAGGGGGGGGLMGRSREELWELQQSLLPSGKRQYRDAQGLPRGTEREYGEGYEKVTIPAPTREDASQLPPRLVLSEIMSPQYARAFAGTASLNPMQSQVFETAFHRRDNLLICAPTGAGKTNVAMLTITAHFRDVGLIGSDNDDDDDDDEPNNHKNKTTTFLDTGKKVVYIAPMKALAQEVVDKFHSKLHPLQLVVRELTGDMQLTRAEAESANVIVTTPEKWDVVTRKSGSDDKSLGNQCGLLIIDEVHLLADERGAVIESVVARTHRLVESRQRQVRIVGLSATLPNYEDVAEFLQVPRASGLFYFGPEHRPVPLQQQFIGVSVQTKDRFVRENKMNDICYEEVVDSLRRGYQVMVFVHSRKKTGDTATALADRASQEEVLERLFVTQGKDGPLGAAHQRYADRVQKSRNREVVNHFQNGMGIHHAGMLRGDRKLTEQMFADGAIRVLCCTATLAWGVNLPCHTVIVKGTEVYNPEKGGNVDLSILDVMQIFGRAGRPQFDTSGEATLITSHDALARYLDKLVRAVPIESNFVKQLADHLNAEVVGGTVTNLKEAVAWLTYTYLYVRMLRNPVAYGVSADKKADDPMLRGRCMELVQDAAMLLDRNKMLSYHVETGNLGVKELGRVAAHFYIQAESVATFQDKLERFQSLTDADLCHLICCATEFENVKIRQEEMNELDGLAKKACPLPVKPPIHDSTDKSYVLLQAFISRTGIKSFTLISDTNYIASNAGRVARAVFEMCLRENKAEPALKLLRIAKTVDKRFWWFQTPLRHFESELKSNVFSALESRKIGAEDGYDSFEAALSLLDMQPEEVGQLCHWAKGGRKVQRFIRLLPRLDLKCMIQPVSSSVLRFHIQLHPEFEWQNRWHGGAEAFWLWVEDGNSNRIYHHEYVIFSRRSHPETITLDFSIPAFESRPKQYFVRAVSDSWVGVEMLLPVSFHDIKLPNEKTPHTDLLDLTPLPVSALQEPKYEELYSNIETFNPIQTQLFHVLYHTDSPLFLGAPTGSGKTYVAELALLRMKRIHPDGICVYIAPLKSLARERLKEWQRRFGKHPLAWNILELSGDTHHDQRALSVADVLVCTPEKWDLISRGWKGSDETLGGSNVSNGKAFVKRVRLLVIDEIHLLGEDRGAVLEAIVSRTRFISRYVENENSGHDSTKTGSKSGHYELVRIMGLSTALANPYDLADWIGIDTKSHGSTSIGLYNFRPSVRPVPLEVHIQGFQGRHYCPRMATMNKPCYAAIRQHSPDKPTLIFVASRRQTRLTAMDIISYAAGDENPRIFLACSEDYIEAVAERIQDDALRHTISFGIGLHHAGLSINDRDIVESLYMERKIMVLVATATLAWGVNLPSHFVIVKGTEYYDGKTSRYIDYPLTDVLQMIGRAGRPGFDTTGVALVMAEESKKNFYKRFLYLPFPVESCLRERMCENLNAEIAIGTIQGMVEAVGYLTWTFFARRVKANPSYYGALSSADKDVELFLLEVVKDATGKLKNNGCIEVEEGDPGDDKSVRPTFLGLACCNYYLQYRTPKQMLFGVKEARRIIMAHLEAKDGDENDSKASMLVSSEESLVPFIRSEWMDEISVAWILYTLSSTHEFDEFPVRHNEEYLNAELSEDLMWGADTSELLAGGGTDRDQPRPAYHNMDVMADPHTKCFLLLQAYLEHAKLPISDYVNDTKTVLDQIPRLLAAMQSIAMNEKTPAGSFELMCQFSRVRQIYETRSMVDDDPLLQLSGFSNDIVRRMQDKSRTLPSIWHLRRLPREEASSFVKDLGRKVNAQRLVDVIYSLPLCTVDDVKVSHHVEKTSGKSQGKLQLTVAVANGNTRKTSKTDGSPPLSLAIVLGSFHRHALLAHTTVTIPKHGELTKKNVELDFDWSAANADGGGDGGRMILRLLHEQVRGLDSEMIVKLS